LRLRDCDFLPFGEPMTALPTQDIARLAERYTPEMVRFLRDMIAIPSESAGERQVVARVRAEMERAGFDEVRWTGWATSSAGSGAGRR
jgi:hypothetical protein